MGRLFKELQRRNVVRAGVTYVVAAWVLLQVVDLLAPALEWFDSATRVTLYALLIGFPIAMLLSWFYQITPDGISLDEDSDQGSPGSQAVDQRLNLIVIALLAAAVILFAYDKWWPQHAEDPSVAVLPFGNISGLEENEYFSDGLTESLVLALTQNAALRVSPITSSASYKNKDVDVRDIGRELGVANILVGSVQRAGGKLRITVQLIRAKDESHLWSAKYDRDLVDIFAIHDEISLSVNEELSRSLLAGANPSIPEGVTTDNVEAFDLFLHALAELHIGSYESLREAEELLKNALVIDPGFIDAKISLANAYISLFDTGAIPYDEGLAQATTLFEQVLAERPSDVGSRLFFLMIELNEGQERGDLELRVSMLEQFHALVTEAPNHVDARIRYARLLFAIGRTDDALEQYEIAVSLDPLNLHSRNMLADFYKRNRDWNAAREQLSRSLEIEPLQPNVAAELGDIGLAAGDAVEFIRQMQKATELDPLDHEMPAIIAETLYELDLIDAGDQFSERVNVIAPNSPAAQSLQIIRAIRADGEAASLEVARQLIRDDADDRRNAWIRAFRHLMLTAVLRERTQDELEFVEEYVPDFSDWDVSAIPWKVGLARAQTMEIWHDLETEQGVLDRVSHMEQVFATLNLPMERVEIVHIDVLLLRGDLDGAIEAALNGLYSHSVLQHLNIKDRFVTPLYTEFNADSRIIAAQERWRNELAQAREDVRQYLADQYTSQ